MIRRYLLDTGIAQDLQFDRRGVRTRARAQRRLGHRIGICTPVLGELWSGVEGSATRESRERNLIRLRHAIATLAIWPYMDRAAQEFGRIYVELKRAGRFMQQIDMQIAAIARTMRNCVVVTKDSDLAAVVGIKVENWAQ